MKVLIVDDQRLMQDGLKTILDLEEDIEVVATCNNGLEAVKLISEIEVDIILMDIRMPALNGVEATRMIKESNPRIKILILTTFDDDEYIIAGLRYGATGYMLKDIDGDCLIDAIKAAYNNNYILPSKIAQKLVQRLSMEKKIEINNIKGKFDIEKSDENITFTEREVEIAKMLAEGFTNKQIASALFLSEGTIKNNVSNIYSKIEISDRTSAALYLKKLFRYSDHSN